MLVSSATPVHGTWYSQNALSSEITLSVISIWVRGGVDHVQGDNQGMTFPGAHKICVVCVSFIKDDNTIFSLPLRYLIISKQGHQMLYMEGGRIWGF